MTQYDQLKMLYKQLVNLTVEEDKLFDSKAYDEIESMLIYKAKLIKRVVILKNMVDFTPEQAAEFRTIEQTYKKNEENNIKKFSKVRDGLELKLKSTNKNLKLKSAYAKVKNEKQGSMLDFSE